MKEIVRQRSLHSSCNRKPVILTIALAFVMLLSFVGCQPGITKSSNTPSPATEDASVATVVGDFQNRDAGMLSDTLYNTSFVNAGNRGCNACHADLWDVMSSLSPIQHVLSSAPGYGQSYGITDCMTCHAYNVAAGGPKLSDLIHTSHYSNAQFTDTQNGNCWSCHATTAEGEVVLWDIYKYSSELGGYPDAANAKLQNWLRLRTQPNSSVVNVVSTGEMKLDVELSQPVSDENDMYVADNYIVPELSADTYELKVTGVENERTFTLEELQALPQTEMTLTQDCLTNAVNGVMIGNFPVKGVLLKDIIEACGGIADGNTSMTSMGVDEWNHCQTVEFLLEQNAIIALQYWGHDLTVDQGYPATLAVPGVGGAFWDKWLGELNFNKNKGFSGSWPLGAAFPDVFQGVQTTGWFSPATDNESYKVNEKVSINGYAFINACNGHSLSQIAFSADYGTTWTCIDVPKDIDQNQWVFWSGTWTPEKSGTYVLHVKAIDSLGSEQIWPASVILTVTE